MQSILFVCWGNICRSPTAEGLMKALVEERGLEEHIHVASAGTIRYHEGEPPDSRMRRAAERRGYELVGEARCIEQDDASLFDLILCMDASNLHDVEEILGELPAHARLLSDFLPAGSPSDVPDPYYGDGNGFEVVLDLLESACPRILDHILKD